MIDVNIVGSIPAWIVYLLFVLLSATLVMDIAKSILKWRRGK